MILLFAGEKGGTGKSTICTNIAVYLALAGKDVMLLDADPQATASLFIERRNSTQLPRVHCTQKTGDVYNTALDLGDRYEYVLIDAGGRDSHEMRTALVACDRFYTPFKASQNDLETMPKMDSVVALAKGMNRGLQAFAFLNMAPAQPTSHEVPEARGLLAEFPQFAVLDSVIRDRRIYRDAASEGKGVVEMSNSKARAEIQLLAREIFQNGL